MDPNLARRMLRIHPDSPLTVELIEGAYAGETLLRHPSLYPDAMGRRLAEEWAQSLAAARNQLLAEASTPLSRRTDATGAPTSARRRMSGGAIAGIVAGGVALLALITFAVIGAANFATQATAEGAVQLESEPPDAPAERYRKTPVADVERYSAGETMFVFPAALEVYNDGLHSVDCSAEYPRGCWQMALLTEADCKAMRIQLGFSSYATSSRLPGHVETITKEDVLANEPTIVVFGNDEMDYGWINQVTCLDR
ncbi:hypothetical protein J7E25_07120 [Agromyces sp. ISL-38]|uniref:hypothetical protein n=1 Tax=Agromyces sp. ISL-38 TaxID=2819107 RepID=UPI001BEA3189|nr:hypothetical protein [Agromyces sp. ISL-38]MBT2498863.1 hypothetical protein [Agromyces sp. ISL-38]